jgi:GT2 family glycosyltransferase
LLRACLRALPAGTAGLRRHIHVVDNNSPDGSAAMVRRQFPDVDLVVNAQNIGFARASDIAPKRADSRYVVLLNPDTEPEPDSLRQLVTFMDAHPSGGACGPKLLNPDGSLQRVGGNFPTLLPDVLHAIGLHRMAARRYELALGYGREDADRWREVDWVSGACLLVRTETMQQVGILDERLFMVYEEIDWCHRIKSAGWKLYFVPEARVVHHLMGTVKYRDPSVAAHLMAARRSDYRKSRLLYYRETGGLLTVLGVRGVTVLESVRLFEYARMTVRRALSRTGRLRR